MRLNSATARVETAGPALEPVTPAWGAPPPETHAHAPKAGATASLLVDYLELFKYRVTGLVTLTAWAGFYMGSIRSGISSLQPGLVETVIGIATVSGGSAALNQAIERKLDAKMKRTAGRPMASGRIGLAHGITVGLLAIVLGSLWLTRETNLITGGLTLLTAVLYVAVYTPLKRFTTLATFVGAFPGALPPLLGWTAARGLIEWQGVALFAILFVWQFPHFMSISWLYRDDYARAGIRMLPVAQPDGWSTALEALVYAVLMIPASLLPYWLHMDGLTYAIVAVVLGLLYLGYTIRFSRIVRARDPGESRMYARDLLKVSVVYLPLLLAALMLNATGK